MPGTYVSDMRHFVPEDPEMHLPPPAARMRDFMGGIVRAATATTRQREFVSGIPCRRRPGNRPCTGSIAVQKTDAPERYVFWECTQCQDNGRIAGFEACAYDLGSPSRSNPKMESQRREVVLTADEYRSWIAGDMVPYDLESMQTIFSAVRSKRGVVISGFDDELDILRDSTAADLNHEGGRKRKRDLSSIFDKLQGQTPSKVKRSAIKSTRHAKGTRTSSRPSSAPPPDPGSAYAHGFFSAIVAGPMVTPTRWLQRFLSPELESIAQLNACAQSVMTACNAVSDRLLNQRGRFDDATLEIARRDSKGGGLVEWQRGFVDAMDLCPEEWKTFLSSLSRDDLLSPLAMISQFSADPIKRAWLADQSLRENLGRSLGVMTARLWEAFRDQPSVQLKLQDASEHEQPKISRNAPCPCGSGEKYKRCCGSTLRAV